MVLMNFVAFVIFKILYDLVSVLLGSAVSFVSFLVPQAVKNVVSFT